MLEQLKLDRLQQLDEKDVLTEEERQEWIKLSEENTPPEEPTSFESLKQIQKERELQPLKDELLDLEMERKRLELVDQIKVEKKRIENLKKHSGLVYCDDCLKWVEPSHFD